MRRLILRYPISTALIILAGVFSAGLLGASLSGVITWGNPNPEESTPFKVLSPSAAWQPFPAPDSTLIDQEGRPFSLRDLRGKLVLVNFIYTRCHDVCPLVTRRLKEAQEKLGTRMGRDVLFVSISVDTQHDTPGVLKQFGKRHGVDFTSWLMLTGSKEELDQTLRGFGLLVEKFKAQSEGLEIPHNTAIYVVDRSGMVADKIAHPTSAVSGAAAAEQFLERHG
ncbi:MAG TPA: SCO family protein [Candidatus Binatia bacterium]|nr:SCO family protein [Candidatus Binatia bacterium]